MIFSNRVMLAPDPDGATRTSGLSLQNESDNPSAPTGLSDTIFVLQAGAEKLTNIEPTGQDLGPTSYVRWRTKMKFGCHGTGQGSQARCLSC